MQRGKWILAAAFTLAAAAARPVNAATPVDINLDFSKAADQAKVMINGDAHFDSGRLVLTTDTGQAGTAFLTNPVDPTADYLATFQFEVKSVSNGQSAADGMAFVAQIAGPDKVGGGGGSLAYVTSDFTPFSYAVEFNTYDGQGLGTGIDQTVAWDAFGQRQKFNQSRFPGLGLVDAGVYTAQVRVQPDQMSVTLSGGSFNMAPIVAMKTTPLAPGLVPSTVTAGTPLFQALAPKPIFFGITGATGGAGTIQEVLNLHIQSPAPAATAGP